MKTKPSLVEEQVLAWEQDIVLPTYPVQAADPNPMFLEKRVYQGSSGKVYPNPFTDRVATEKAEHSYRAIMLENQYVQLMILPEIGGRIHIGLDKTNGYNFFYRQHVIKPALVGLLGPWISGGVEFNWPQHHRPSTYMPVHASIEEGADGSRTVWLSEHDPMSRMKGMVGICLYPGKSIVEAKVRLYNRTPLPQSFLWWANVGVRVHDQYQAFFPPDVTFVADHARRAVSSFPVARNFYYGVDYRKGVDLSWYKNIPVPTSYMVTKSKYDFFGGYDHAREAGFVHISDHHVAPGKKLWTWGNADFGYAWERNLTDEDGPYIELMAGAFTDNQPDFSWLQPYETKTFSQFWYPIQQIGPAKNANSLAAISLDAHAGSVRVGVCTTQALSVRVSLKDGDNILFERNADLDPGQPLVEEIAWDGSVYEDLRVEVFDLEGNVLLAYQPELRATGTLPEPATEPSEPAKIETNEELYLTGLHLEQYRHATRLPDAYWREGLKRDPQDVRLNNAMGLFELRRGAFDRAENYFRTAIQRLTARNPNPSNGEPYYNLGLALQYMGHLDEAYDSFYKCVWNYAWQSAGYYALASIDTQRLQLTRALEHVEKSLQTNISSLKARGLKAALLRRMGRVNEAASLVHETLLIDPLDFRSMAEEFFLGKDATSSTSRLLGALEGDIQTTLDLAFDYMAEGLLDEALQLLLTVTEGTRSRYPIVYYALWWISKQRGEQGLAAEYATAAANAPSLYCFPARLEEMVLLEAATSAWPNDAKASYYLGNLYYDKRRYEEAIRCWRTSVQVDSSFSIPWRNLGIAEYNILRNPTEALNCYALAFAANPKDARVLYEWDQLKKRVGINPLERIAALAQQRELVDLRDDLTVEYSTLLNQTGNFVLALELLSSCRFSPWEGGEGLVSGQFVHAHMSLGRASLIAGDAALALEHFNAARRYPENLGEGKHFLAIERDIDYCSGFAAQKLEKWSAAETYYAAAAAPVPVISLHSYYQALALRQLGQEEECRIILRSMLAYATEQRKVEPRIDYFATSLPNFLLFEDDLRTRTEIDCLYLTGLAELGLKNIEAAQIAFNSVLKLECGHLNAQEQLRSIAHIASFSADPLPIGAQR